MDNPGNYLVLHAGSGYRSGYLLRSLMRAHEMTTLTAQDVTNAIAALGDSQLPVISTRPFFEALCSLALRGMEREGEAPAAYCEPFDPFASTAFSWPGTERKPEHTTALYTHPAPSAVSTDKPLYRFRLRAEGPYEEWFSTNDRALAEKLRKTDMWEVEELAKWAVSTEAVTETTALQLAPVIEWLEAGCSPLRAAHELRLIAQAALSAAPGVGRAA